MCAMLQCYLFQLHDDVMFVVTQRDVHHFFVCDISIDFERK